MSIRKIFLPIYRAWYKLAFKVNPLFLADVLGKTRKMKCGEGLKFVAFVSDNFTYVTTVEWVKG